MHTVALDFNAWGGRGVLVDEMGELCDWFDSRSPRTARLWLRRVSTEYPGTHLVASPLDDVPEEVRNGISDLGVQPTWLSPTLIRQLYQAARPWNLPRKLLRARLLAYFHCHDVVPELLARRLRDFEHKLARETLGTDHSL